MHEWRARDGRDYLVRDMRTGHIRNCLRMLEDGRFNDAWTALHGDKWKIIFENELDRRMRSD